MADISDTVAARGRIYGDFLEQSRIVQMLKNVIQLQPKWPMLEDDQKEALEMMCTKVARIMNGDPNYADNWADIEGYAHLVRKRLESE